MSANRLVNGEDGIQSAHPDFESSHLKRYSNFRGAELKGGARFARLTSSLTLTLHSFSFSVGLDFSRTELRGTRHRCEGKLQHTRSQLCVVGKRNSFMWAS